MGHTALADDGLHLKSAPPGSMLVAEEGDDSYDPFADYSEFQEAADEEEDVNFFKNGRLLTFGFIAGYRGFTGDLGKILKGGADFGLTLTYFFDLRFALELGYQTSSHTMHIPAGNSTAAGYVGDPYNEVDGTDTYSDISINLKYYFNTQNVTRGLADLNPYLLAGISQFYVTETRSDVSDFYGKDSAFGANLGVGIEIPMMRNKMYFGAQAIYSYINLPNQGSRISGSNDGTNLNIPSNYTKSGGTYTTTLILGCNF